MRIAEGFEEAARKRRTARQVRRVIADFYEKITGDELASESVESFIKSWLERKVPETAASTLVFYQGATKKFLKFLGDDKAKSIGEITPKEILTFRNEEIKTLAAKTVNHDLKVLRLLFKAARREGLIAEDPTEFVDTVRDRDRSKRAPKRRPFMMDEIEAVIAAANPEWKSMVMFGLYTGQRLGDVATLLRQDIDLKRKQLTIVTRKTGKRLTIPLAPPLLDFLERKRLPTKPTSPIHPKAYDIVTVQKNLATCPITSQRSSLKPACVRSSHTRAPGKDATPNGMTTLSPFIVCVTPQRRCFIKQAFLPRLRKPLSVTTPKRFIRSMLVSVRMR